jgi:hypothetical protein
MTTPNTAPKVLLVRTFFKRICQWQLVLLATLLAFGSPLVACERYQGWIDSGNSTITDPRTGNVWLTCNSIESEYCSAEGYKSANWTEALEIAKKATHQGKTDWRLPTEDELKAVLDPRPCVFPRQFGLESTRYRYTSIWTGSVFRIGSDREYVTKIWIPFGKDLGSEMNSINYFLLVRSDDRQKLENFNQVYEKYVVEPARAREQKIQSARARERNSQEVAELTRTYKCDQAKTLWNTFASSEQPYFSYETCVNERKYRLALSEKDPQSVYLAAGSYQRAGDSEKAVALYESIISRFSSTSWAVKSNDQLNLMRSESIRNKSSGGDGTGKQLCEAQKQSCLASCGDSSNWNGSRYVENQSWFGCKSKCNSILCR